jgi:hypothetical protein
MIDSYPATPFQMLCQPLSIMVFVCYNEDASSAPQGAIPALPEIDLL